MAAKLPPTILAAALVLLVAPPLMAQTGLPLQEGIYQVGSLKPVDSQLKVAVGQMAPDFSLPAVGGGRVSLSQYRGKKNVLLTFVPSAWTPICSAQWPGYNLTREEFEERDTILLGITTDNIPTLYAWTQAMGGVWFPVLSDFWPHGAVAQRYGILRGEGVSERAMILIDKAGVLRYIDVHDINQRPELGQIISEIDKIR
jgi:peroxiredoxin (alkyl hydroperoxide reductase subunit C)